MEGLLYACQPCYGAGNKASKKVFWSQSVNPKGPYAQLESVFDDYGSSLLADAFNVHWKTALNMQLNGRPVTRFAMLHDDVVPEQFWLDKLLAELDRTGADIVASVIPIKDSRALSSTALYDPFDQWEVYRRLTMNEVHKLPETFSIEDCREAGLVPPHHRDMAALLVNTGCWICDFTKPWRFDVNFQVHSRIAFVVGEDHGGYKTGQIVGTTIPQAIPTIKGAFINQVMSEDWDFSRQVSIQGGKILATRKVNVDHMGDFPYPSRGGDWGKWTQDEDLRRKFDPTWKDIPQVSGWLTENEGRALAEFSKDKVVLEIGSYCGLSTIWMARKAFHVYAVDTFDNRGIPTNEVTIKDPLTIFKYNMEKHGVHDKVTPIVGESKNACKESSWKDSFNFAFVDGGHDQKSIEEDLETVNRTVAKGSLVAFHDYGRATDTHDVTKVVDYLLKTGQYQFIKQVDSLIVARKSY